MSWENGWEGFSDNLHRGWAPDGQFGHPNEHVNLCPTRTGQHLNTLLRSTRPRWSCSKPTSPTTPGPRLGSSFPGTCSGLPGAPGCLKRRHCSDATTLSHSGYPSSAAGTATATALVPPPPPPSNSARLIKVLKRPAGTQLSFSNLDGVRASVSSEDGPINFL